MSSGCDCHWHVHDPLLIHINNDSSDLLRDDSPIDCTLDQLVVDSSYNNLFKGSEKGSRQNEQALDSGNHNSDLAGTVSTHSSDLRYSQLNQGLSSRLQYMEFQKFMLTS